MVDFEIFAGTNDSGSPVETITVTLGENAEGQGNTGNGSQGRIVSGELAPGTYTVCEVEVAYKSGSPSVALDARPRPEAGNGGSTGGQQTLFSDNCITVELKAGTAELKFLDLVVAPTPTPIPTPEATPTPTPDATPTPTPEGNPLPTQGTPTPTPKGDVEGATGTPGRTLPPTDTLTSTPAAPSSDSWRLILLAMAGLLSAALLLSPATSVIRKDDDR